MWNGDKDVQRRGERIQESMRGKEVLIECFLAWSVHIVTGNPI